MSATTLKSLEIVRFELAYQLRRKATWFFFAAFAVMLLGQTNGQVIDAFDGEIPFHAPVLIAETSVTITLAALLVLAAIAGDAATRDVELRIEALMHASPVGRTSYFGGRFLGAAVVMALLLVAVPLAVLLAPVWHPALTAELSGPLHAAAYVESYVLLLVPNAIVMTALLFAMATLVRHAMGSYLGAVLIVAISFVSRQIIGQKLGRWDIAQLLDPTGITAIEVLSSSWSPADLDTRLVASEGVLLWNRLLWLAIALAVLAFARTRFRFGRAPGATWWHGRGAPATGRHPDAGESGADAAAFFAVSAAHDGANGGRRTFGRAARARQTLAIARDSLREMVTGWSWLVVPFVALQIVMSTKLLGFLGTPYLPTTSRVLESFGGTLNFLLVFVVLFAGELVWRERDANMQSLADSVPVPNSVRFGGKLLGLWLVIVALHAVLMLAGILLQVRYGYYEFDLPLYARILFGLELIGSFVFALLALSVHVLVNHKHVGHVAVLLFVLATKALLPAFGLVHPLLVYGSDPGWRYSPISGFEPHLAPYLWFESYWAAWTLLIALAAFLFWSRGVELGLRERMRVARRRFRGRTAAAACAAIALVLVTGGFIFYNTNVLNEYQSPADEAARSAAYERRYKQIASAPQPVLTATELHVELYPERRAADVRGVHQLVNRTARPIDTIHVAVSPAVQTGDIDFGRAARATLRDDELGQQTYVLEQPLRPGESLPMRWTIRYAARGFTADGIDMSVIGNGSFIQMAKWMPLIGYQLSREFFDPAARRVYGLPERPAVPSLYDVQARHDPAGRERAGVKVTIGTAANEIAVGPGPLRKTWHANGRRYFEYATDAPVGIGYAIFSADYAVRKARFQPALATGEAPAVGQTGVRPVDIEVIHHPAHDLNVERMTRGMQASLAQFTRRFGPYPHGVLRMVEHQSDGGGAHAANTTIWYEELFSLFDPASDERRIDLPFAVVAHEVAHQFQAPPARVEGSGLISESFAWYAAMGVIEQEYGEEHLQRFLRFMRQAFLNPSSRAGAPLIRATDWLKSYRVGPFAMNALRAYVGQDRVDLAWRRMFDQHRSGEPPFATSLDLLRELREVTPASLQYLLGDLFERNTFWELETRRATAHRASNGHWSVTLEVAAEKVVVDEQGAESGMPMNDLVEIGVFAARGDEGRAAAPLYRAMHRIQSGTQTITVVVPRKPASAGIDPRHLLLDVAPNDNVVDIAEELR